MANACVNMRLTSFFVCAIQRVGSSFSDQGWNPCPLQWELLVLITGLPGKSLFFFSSSGQSRQLFIVLIFKKHLLLCIYVAAPGLSCGTWDLPSSLQQVGSLVSACGI